MDRESRLRHEIKMLLKIFIVGLIISGVSAFPLELELKLADKLCHSWKLIPPDLEGFIHKVYGGVLRTNENFPFIAYGTDWLAFAHLILAVLFIGPMRDPVRNIWVIEFGIISCIGIFPMAFIAGSLRGIPFFWQLIDCSFGVVGGIVLANVLTRIRRIEKIVASNTLAG